ncbi:Serine/threonine protein Kinase [Phytophthora palmivora]|uniref:Serine/threonine protein Kinase n=1 Tax=Phytophthora palmivora TaxID=4796 RepID=A0A2P4XVR5_9STRA|nr:Serine/threonine protein Kinase [Phytophthora palmivora]
MAANLLDLAALGLGSALTLLGQLYTKFSQLKEGRELCISLHDRLKAFADELKDVAPETLQSENLLPQLQNLIREFADTVTIYAESNFAKRVMKADKFAGQVKIYNERLDSIVAMLSVNRTVLLVEWRSQFQHDSDKMISELATINKHNREIWMAIKQLPTKKDVEDMVLVIKRELLDHDDVSNPESTPSLLDPVMRSIVNVAEKKFLDGKAVQSPPPWLIAADEVTTAADPIDSEGQSEILVGDWQGVPVAIKRFNVVDDNPVSDKHFKIWRTLLHPHVAQLYGAGSRDGAPFFAYEYVRRRSLDRCWHELSEKQVWRLLYQAAVGLEYLHKKHVVHGNLSCSKFLVTDQGDIKLFGFGASYVRIDNRSNSIKPETREEFAAPECIGIGPNGKDCGFRHSPSFESDVYSFGLTIMEAVAKKDPLDGMTLREIRALKRQNQLRRPEGMSGKAWNLVQRMCVCDPTQRVSLTYVKEELDVVRYLVDRGVDIDKPDSNGNTPLLLAARWGKLDVVQYLVEQGVDKEIQNKLGHTPLIWAATSGNLDEVRCLVEHGVEKDKRDYNGKTALIWAAANGKPNVVKYLVDHGADKDKLIRNKADPTGLDNDGNSVLLVLLNHPDITEDELVPEVSVVQLRRFLKEVNTWRNLRHTNVVPFYGANLRKEPEEYRMEKLNEIAAGLGYLHSREIAHGDLKGNNIVVNDNGTAMLTDFGLSFQESGSCSIKDMKDKLGAMAWRAPEFAHMTVMTPTRKSDVYSLGMCIIEAVTLKNPWSGYDNEEIRHFLRNGVVSVTKPDEMTESQWELVEWMIAASPDDRPNLSEVAQKLEEFANDEEYEHDR